MFQMLLESNAAPAPRVGGSLISTLGHASVVAAIVVLTASPPRGDASPVLPRARFIPVLAPPIAPTPPRNAVHADPMSTPSAPGAPALSTVIDIPIGLPPIDLGMPETRLTDYGGRPIGTPGGTGTFAASAVVDGGALTLEQVDKPVVLRPGARVPAYPEMLRSAGMSGSVIVEFVVDTLGRVESGSLRMVQADHELFSSAVGRVVPSLRFIPAEAAGKKVRQLVRIPYRFDLHS
ncbi:MAG: energy transducer TonB [Gemmatimonas sp.]